MPPTALIVDDDPGFRRAARRLLAARGFEVVAEAADAGQALEAVRAHHPDCVLLDLHLPDTDGLSAARALAASPAPAPRILVTSTEPADFATADLTALGIVAFVAKDHLATADLPALFGFSAA
ncbi:response regulator [Amycolatopsis carbonis]|uniref:Response regulator n=1 Tax=Amycolatopsis carbonis TaxID=715471 RepID=A0A9Y2MW75_9PSEU|nr:response regulator [Amycolatopsis sp. 2-15]WIX77502.1 response regulator [Amycolatopsis sp. 2-15]